MSGVDNKAEFLSDTSLDAEAVRAGVMFNAQRLTLNAQVSEFGCERRGVEP
jgi:hypothetical protein